MAECMHEANVKVIWLQESATQCLSDIWDNQYPEEDWETLCFQVTLLLIQLEKEADAVFQAGTMDILDIVHGFRKFDELHGTYMTYGPAVPCFHRAARSLDGDHA